MNKFCKLCVNLQQVLEQVLDKFYKFWETAAESKLESQTSRRYCADVGPIGSKGYGGEARLSLKLAVRRSCADVGAVGSDTERQT